MIIILLLTVIVGVVSTVLSLLPSLPATPEAVTDIGDFIIEFMTGMFGFIVHIYTPVLAGAIVSMILALLFFNQGYHVLMFVLKKAKILG
ncbi:MAG TPA: hypothetical protein PLU21_01005 [Candidatus Saccharibacteria bacterium]|nr:hypothetical protein [Candidatus Saccharibacteria bacterium]